ncbi:trehalose-phosphatase [Mycobacterium xenopi RIVM700367]|uniref:trehalose-phosphatase n=1 Tax=Mycobacterium xenopi TaxID=1789 RepID=UPI00025AD69B|nr:trehalose-phosphatase [Mycobacterium xenopi]EID14168.1 trehalose-phosphatase [Mycobacterium xenopi RIVM700367]
MTVEVTIDSRYYDAVILGFDSVMADSAHIDAPFVAFVRRLHDARVRTGIYSSNADCQRLLVAAGIADLIPICVNGVVNGRLKSSGTSDANVLLETAAQLGVRPERCAVIEGSVAGIIAARDGGFVLVIGVDRTGDLASLQRSGADGVVSDITHVEIRHGGRRMSRLPDALQSYGQIGSILVARQPVVVLNFDGTLSAIVDDCGTATGAGSIAQTLELLAAHCNVALLSGRDLTDMRSLLGLSAIWYAGNHGLTLTAPDGTGHQNEDATSDADALEDAAVELSKQIAHIGDVYIERKRFAVAVHYSTLAPEVVSNVIAMTRSVAQHRGLRISQGRRVIELRPDIPWDKGKVVEWILRRIDGPEPMVPIYIGADITDEGVFDALRHSGIGIIMRHGKATDHLSAARFALDSPGALCEFIERLAQQLAAASDEAKNPWSFTFTGYDPQMELLREALCTVGNGYFATRGCVPEATAGNIHYPGTYAAGIYNRLDDYIDGATVTNESLVNLPNWLPLTFRVNAGPWFDIDDVELLSYVQTLDLRRAMLNREFRFRDADGRTTQVIERRFVAMHLPHVAALQTMVTAENWSGRIEFRSAIHGDIENQLVQRYAELSSKHLVVTQLRELSNNAVVLAVATVESRIPVAVAARTTVWHGEKRAQANYQRVQGPARIGHDIAVEMAVGESVTLEKIVTIVTGRDRAISEPTEQAERYLHSLDRFSNLLHGHILSWANLWERFNIDIGENADELRITRLHLLHLLQTLSPNTADLDTGAPARGLHGEAYRGHIFWDELLIFPVLNMHLPMVTRSLLQYRYRRLPQARRAALEAGYAGAMLPWQSGSDGREESPQLHLNPRSGRWHPDPSARAHHSGIAVAYNIWQYYQVTGDVDYLVDYGAEMLIEIARFWVSLACFDAARERYVIRGVIGPDEFHSGYPGRVYDGIDNNAYTNVMVVWVIMRAMEALELLPLSDRVDLLERLGVDGPQLDRWEDVSRRMFVPFHDGVISQFEGYDELVELDWDAYRARYGNIQRLDRILEAENDDVNNYKASKQADVLMLFYLLSSDELRELFARLKYRFAPEQIPKTIDYYRTRTSHGSTLSAVVHSWVLARGDRDQALNYFQQVLLSDIADIQGGTAAEGIHLAAMAGSIDLLQRCFTGLEFRGNRIVLAPLWPEKLGKLAFPLRYRGHRLHLEVCGRRAKVSSDSEQTNVIDVECRGQVQRLMPGHTIEFS